MRYFFYFLLAIIFLYNPMLFAEPIDGLSLSKDFRKIILGRHLEYYEDIDRKLTIDDIIKGKEGVEFQRSEKDNLGFGYTQSAIWIKISFYNIEKRALKSYLELAYPLLDYFEFYTFRKGKVEKVVLGDRFPFSQRPYEYRNFVIPLDQEPGINHYILRCASAGSLNMPLILWSPKSFLRKLNIELPILWMFYGIALVMIFYNLIVFFSTNDKSYLFYILFIIGLALSQLSMNGLAFQYLWPNWIWWAHTCIPFFIFFALLSIGFFTRSFLNTKEMKVVLDRILIIFIYVSVAGMSLSFFISYQISAILATLIAIILMFYLIIVGLYGYRHHYRSASFFLVSWAAFLMGTIIYGLKTFGIVQESFITQWSMQIGAALQIVLLALGLADKINAMRKELGVLNVGLENKVYEKTHELKEALGKAESLSLELKELSLRDPLTGLHNRRYLSEIELPDGNKFVRNYKYSKLHDDKREAGNLEKVYGLFLIDLDHFKKVNDTYGHEAGDMVLKKVSSIFHMAVRQTDAILRWGGEEFLIILKNTGESYLDVFAEKLRQKVESADYPIGKNKSIKSTCSIGFVSYPFIKDDAELLSYEEVINLADHAMYIAKTTGRNKAVRIYKGHGMLDKNNIGKLFQSLDWAVENQLIQFKTLGG